MGKRDYAVLLLASTTGLRAIDIANLKFANINRISHSIDFLQHKTGQSNSVPLIAGVLEAIDDYCVERPEVDTSYVFLTLNRPYRKLHDMSSVRNILNRYLRQERVEKSPYDGKSFHAFRRTVGKWLLETGNDPKLISQVLGHRDGEVLKRYLPLADELLRNCALDFEAIPVRAEVYHE